MVLGTLLRAGLLASVLAQGLPDNVAPRGGPLSLPPGRVATLLESIDPARPGKRVEPPWPAWQDHGAAGWGGEAPWRRWVELVRAEARAATPDPERRAALAVLARLQGRDGAAWEHLLACGRDPELVRGLLPLFVPGVPQARLGESGPLPDGVVLAPALPPCDDPAAMLRVLAGSSLDLRALEIGAARCALHLVVDRTGVEVTIRHLEGGPARVALLPPLPLGVAAGQLSADWEKRPGPLAPVEFQLDAESNEHTLWLTFRPPEELWPRPLPAELGAGSSEREIVLATARGDDARLARCAQALGELLGVRASLAGPERALPAGREPLVVHLGDDPGSEQKLVQLLGACEAFLLAPRGR